MAARAMESRKLELPPSMIISPGLSRGIRVWICLVVGSPAGTMIQTALGESPRLSISSSMEKAATAPSVATSRVLSGERLYATTRWPPRRRRCTIFAPIRPSPIKPSSMWFAPGKGLGVSKTTDDLMVALDAEAFQGGADRLADVFDAYRVVAFDVEADGATAMLLEGLHIAC